MNLQVNNDKIIYGNQNFMIPSHMNFGMFVIEKMLLCKENVALIDGSTGIQITAGELVQNIVYTSGALIRLGVKRDEVVAVCSENRTEFLVVTIAAWCIGVTVTFLNAAYSQEEMVHSMNISKPKYIFYSPDTYKRYRKTIANTKLIKEYFIFDNTENDMKTNFNEFIKTHIDLDSFRPFVVQNGLSQTALILYSSGTTGLPKGAKLTHLNLITTNSRPHLTFTKDSPTMNLKCLVVAPWSNTVGIVCTLIELTHNLTVVYLPRFKEEQYLSCIDKYKIGMLLVVPPLVVMFTKSPIIHKYDLSSVKLMYSGGAPLDLSVILEAKKRFINLINIFQGYGMTECSGAVTEETVTDFRAGSVGKVILGNIIKVVDIETRNALGPHQKGEVCIKGPLLFGGYIGRDLNTELDKDGFFPTGDICYYDEDGYFFYVDRIKELIKYKAGQVTPSELEAILVQHPGVKDAGVVGKPDEIAGELPTAFVVKKPGIDLTEKELKDFVAAKVSPWKQLRGGVYFVKEIPKVGSGKILRRILREYLKEPRSKL